MATVYIRYPAAGGSGGITTYATFSVFPATATDGAAAVALDTDVLYIFNSGSSTWLPVGGPGIALSLGAVGSSPNANAASITANVLSLQPASATFPGVLTTGAQSIAGAKTFTGAISASNLSGTNTGDVSIGTASGLSLVGQALSLGLASAGVTGALSGTDWSTFNNKQAALTIGNLTDVGTDGIVVTGGTGAVIGSGTSIAQTKSDATHNGYLSSTDWSTFNGKQAALTIGNITDVGTDGIVITGGTGAIIGSGVAIAQTKADSTHNGYLSSTDWSTFNGKQAAGTYVTSLTVTTGNGVSGSFTAGATPALSLTLGAITPTTVNGNTLTTGTGTLTLSTFTLTVAGTASISGTHSGTSSGTNTGDQTITLTSDVTGSGTGSFATTIAANAVTNAKAAQMAANTLKGNNTAGTANAADLTVAQVNTMLGTLSNPMTTGGDIIYGGSSGTPTRLANGSAGQFLSSAGGTSAPTWSLLPSDSAQITNLGISATVGSNALTFALKQSDGSTDPAAGAGAVKIGFRSSTLTSGLYNLRSVTGALSVVVSSGSTLGTANNVAAYIYLYAIDNAGTVELAVSQSLFSDYSLVTTVAEGGAGAADSNAVIYSTTARTGVPVRLIGRLLSTQTTAGTWAAAMTEVTLVAQSIADINTVSARYHVTSGQSGITTATIINFDTKDFDTHNAVTTGASWKFTAPVAGKYQINSQLSIAATYTANQRTETELYKNGSQVSRMGIFRAPVTTGAINPGIGGSDLISLAVGDTIDIRAVSDPSVSTSATAVESYITIVRVGN